MKFCAILAIYKLINTLQMHRWQRNRLTLLSLANMLCSSVLLFLSLLMRCCIAKLGYEYPTPAAHNNNDYTPATAPGYGYAAPQSSQQPDAPQIDYGAQGSSDYAAYNKEFYAFESGYDTDEQAELAEQEISAVLQKNLRVVFIKAPENKGLEGAFHALAKQMSEDKTAIYVLNKQNDAADLASKLRALRLKHNSKPEVHFVKYRTPEEAAHAQQHIQAHYDGLPGPTQHFNGGYPQVLNYGSAPATTEPSTAGAGYYAGSAAASLLAVDAPSQPPIDLPSFGYGTGYGTENNVERMRDDYEQDLNKMDFKVNERRRAGAKMIFPADEPTRLHNSYLPPYKRKR